MERELVIEKFAAGGRGLARAEGKVIFVAGALPGERVIARIEKSKARFEEAVAVRRLESPYGEAACPRAEACGGCGWMRLPYEAQLAHKAALVYDEFARAGFDAAARRDPEASPATLGYRCRVTLKLQGHRAGYFAPASHTFVPIDDCPVAAPAIRAAVARLPGAVPGWVAAGYREIELRAAPGDAACVGVLQGRGAPAARPAFLRGLAGTGFAEGDCTLRYEAGGCRLEAGPLAFVQVNLAVNARLVAAAVEALAGAPAVVDAFCGIGNFGVPLAKAGARVLGLEGNAPAVDAARANAARNGAPGAAWHVAAEVKMAAAWRAAGFPAGAALLLDPPRAGAPALAAAVAERQVTPARIAYVSCDPGTLLRDAKTLAAAGYALTRLQVFDMFPQTHHVETLALFETKG